MNLLAVLRVRGTNAVRKAMRAFRLHVLRDPFLVTAQSWFRDHGDQTLRLNYDLNSESVVFDVGGYHGDWAASIFDRYGANIYIFEPIEDFYNQIMNRFSDNPKIHCYKLGLSNINKTLDMMIKDDSTSAFILDGKPESVELKDIVEFVTEKSIVNIDLIKINIEGGEYPLLARIIDSGLVASCGNIQVQFHMFYPDAVRLREEIRNKLMQTHYLTYDYPFIWENWQRFEAATEGGDR